MKWAHLPEPGGLYAQDPELLIHFQIIFGELAKEDAKREAQRKNEQNSQQNTMGRRGKSVRRRR